jgi:hypothetical protein
MSAPLAQPPALIIRLELEAAPQVLQSCMNEGEEDRLADWLNSHPELLHLVMSALAEAKAT